MAFAMAFDKPVVEHWLTFFDAKTAKCPDNFVKLSN